jgi:hypothetical protein
VDEAEGDDIDGAAPPIAATYEAFADRYGS